jgi:Zn-dependent protease
VSKEQGSGRTGLLGAIAKMGSKFAGVAPKLFKILKLGKIGLAGASLAGYTVLFSWQFAIVIMGVIFIHEYAHVLAMKRFRMRVKGMYFIPFVGAAAVPDEDFPVRTVEAVTAYAGPLTGLLLGLLGLLIYAITRNGYVAAITGFTALINLFNLLPVSPLDGGRVAKSVAMSIGSRFGLGFMIAALIVLAVVALKTGLIIFAILIPLGLVDFLYERGKLPVRPRNRRPGEYQAKHDRHAFAEDPASAESAAVTKSLSRRAIPAVFAAHVGLAVALFVIMLVMRHEPGAAAALHILQD